MKILIAVPSKGRAQAIFKRTLRWLPRTGYQLRVFVEPQEIEAYRKEAELANGDNYTALRPEQFVDIASNDKGLGYCKEFIKQYATAHGFDLVFKMDDDVMRFNARGKNKSDDDMILDFCNMVGECRVKFGESPDIGAIGFGYRNELFEPKKWSAVNARLQTCYLIRTELLQSGYNHMEDFAQYVYLRAKNYLTLRYGLLGIDCSDVGKNKGGLQLFDRQKMAEVEANKLRELYPAIVFKAVKGKPWQLEPVMTGDFFGIKKL